MKNRKAPETVEVMKVTAQAHREGEWWAIEVPEMPGVYTQARSLAEAPEVARDAVALLVGVPKGTVRVSLRVVSEAAVKAKRGFRRRP